MLHTQRGAIYPLRKVRSFNMCSKMMEILYQLFVASTVHTLLWCALALVTPIDWRKILGKLDLWLAPKWILFNLWCRGAHWTNCYPSLVYPDFFIMSVTVTNCFHPQLNNYLIYLYASDILHTTYCSWILWTKKHIMCCSVITAMSYQHQSCCFVFNRCEHAVLHTANLTHPASCFLQREAAND